MGACVYYWRPLVDGIKVVGATSSEGFSS